MPTKFARTSENPSIERSAPVARAKNKNEDEACARLPKECRSKRSLEPIAMNTTRLKCHSTAVRTTSSPSETLIVSSESPPKYRRGNVSASSKDEGDDLIALCPDPNLVQQTIPLSQPASESIAASRFRMLIQQRTKSSNINTSQRSYCLIVPRLPVAPVLKVRRCSGSSNGVGVQITLQRHRPPLC